MNTLPTSVWTLPLLYALTCNPVAAEDEARLHVLAKDQTLEHLAKDALGSADLSPELLAFNGLFAEEAVPGTLIALPGMARREALQALGAAVQAKGVAEKSQAGEFAAGQFNAGVASYHQAQDAKSFGNYVRSRLIAEHAQNLFEEAAVTADLQALRRHQASATILTGAAALTLDGGSVWTNLTVGATIPSGAIIRTSPGGRISLTFAEGSSLALLRESMLEVCELQEDVRSGHRTYRLRLLEGALEGIVAAEEDTSAPLHFSLDLAGAEVDLPGCRFRARMDEDKALLMCREGNLQIRGKGSSVVLAAGEGLPFRPAEGMGAVVTLPTAPQIPGSGAEPQVSPSQQVAGAWQPQPGVSTYLFELGRDPQLNDKVEEQLVTTLHANSSPLPDGLYYWRVTAQLPSGLHGLASAPVAVKLQSDLRVKLQFSDTAITTDNGDVILPRESRIQTLPRVESSSVLRIEARLDDGVWTPTTDAGISLDRPGAQVLAVRGMGLNEQPGPELLQSFNVDATGPRVRMHCTPPIDWPGKGRLLRLTVLADDPSGLLSLETRKAGWFKSWKPITGPLDLPVKEHQTLKIRATDRWGNTSERKLKLDAQGLVD